MKISFYHYLMTERDPHKQDEITLFANSVFKDLSFPKHSNNYTEISHYLELNGSYLASMVIFDEAWENYLNKYNY